MAIDSQMAFLRWFCLWCLPTFGVAAGAAWLLNLPAFRMERARLFLDILQLGLKSGRSVEETILAASDTRDESLGARFHLLAALLSSGRRFGDALGRAGHLVPEPIRAMLAAGTAAGILPAAVRVARQSARMPDAQLRAALSCQIIMLFILNPLVLISLPYFLTKVIPVLGEIQSGFGARPPLSMRFLIDAGPALFCLQVASILFLYLGALFYMGGNRFARWIEAGVYPFSAWLALRIPWKRKRLHRDFSAMFALMLDAGLAEKEALELAASSVSNEIFSRRAERAVDELRHGMSLPQALEFLDPPREFAWRLANALQRKGNFTAALQGWLAALDAEADAQEQSAGDLISTALVFGNGLIVAITVSAVMDSIFRIGLVAS